MLEFSCEFSVLRSFQLTMWFEAVTCYVSGEIGDKCFCPFWTSSFPFLRDDLISGFALAVSLFMDLLQ
ncbi:hypothetical protein P8452_61790 [Trifolium repens]|nr:hypothetical protein P8452_61790 [Trifolium repens]